MTQEKINLLNRKLQESRYRLIQRDIEFAGILMDMLFVAVDDIKKISTNGYCIYFNASWLERLNNWSLDYALSHQLVHIEKGHIYRQKLYKGERFHFACNVIVNAALIKRGYTEEKLPGIGELWCTTLFPQVDGLKLSPEEAFRMCPMDPSTLSASKRARFVFDSDEYWDKAEDRGETGIIVLSPSDEDPYNLKSSEHRGGNFKFYQKKHGTLKMPRQNTELVTKDIDDLDDFTTEYTESRPKDIKETVLEIRDLKTLDERDHDIDAMAERVVRDIKIIPKDWRSILNHFIMIETRDYEFLPPDKRLQGDFFLPDYTEDRTEVLNVLFMVDISASLTNDEFSMALNELSAAIEQFGGMLEGTIGFFDTEVRCTLPITTVNEIYKHAPNEGGGTDMHCVFSYVRRELSHNLPSEIVIMTDGKCDFPDYSETLGIPVLWLLTSDRVRIPYGRAAHFEHKQN